LPLLTHNGVVVSLFCWQQAKGLPTAAKDKNAVLETLAKQNRNNRDVIIGM